MARPQILPYSAWQDASGQVVIVAPAPKVLSRGIVSLVLFAPESPDYREDMRILTRREFLGTYTPVVNPEPPQVGDPWPLGPLPPVRPELRLYERLFALLYANRRYASSSLVGVCAALILVHLPELGGAHRALLYGAVACGILAGWRLPRTLYGPDDVDLVSVSYRHLRHLTGWEWVSSRRDAAPRCPECERSGQEGHATHCARRQALVWVRRAMEDTRHLGG